MFSCDEADHLGSWIAWEFIGGVEAVSRVGGAGLVGSPTISLPIADGAVAVELTDGRVVFAAPDSDPDAVRRYVGEREAAR